MKEMTQDLLQEINSLIEECNKLLRGRPDFVTTPENGYAHIKVEWDNLFERNCLFVNTSEDKVITMIDLQCLRDQLQEEQL